MRVVKELSKEGIQITVFSWNNKYLIKFEEGLIEQTFKVAVYDVLEEQDLDKFQEGEFFDSVKKRFEEMHVSLQKHVENI